MFGFGKKRVLERMGHSYQKSQLAIFGYLKEKKYKVRGSILEGEKKMNMAAAIANFMFGQEPVQIHLDEFDIKEIESIGYQLIDKNHNLKELVVQSMRVYLILWNQGVMDTPIDIDIIEKYGSEFPDAPSPSSYEALLDKLDDWVPPPTLGF
jgi:hypothetical protein